MAEEVVGRAVLPAREGWWPAWVRRLLRQGKKSRRRRVVEDASDREPEIRRPEGLAVRVVTALS